MKARTILYVLLICSCRTNAAQTSDSPAEQFLCVAERSAGFNYQATTDSWNNANFRTDAKYIIAQSKDSYSAYEVKRVGDNIPSSLCAKGFNEAGFLFCSGIGGDLKFNRDNGRFLLAYTLGYYNVLPKLNKITDSTSDTPLIEIGKCSPF